MFLQLNIFIYRAKITIHPSWGEDGVHPGQFTSYQHFENWMDFCKAVYWLARSSHSKKAQVLNPNWDLYVWSLDVLLMHAWGISGHSAFQTKSQNMLHRPNGVSKLSLDVHMSFCVIVLPCIGLATCPGCTLTFSKPTTPEGIHWVGKKDGWVCYHF